MPHFPNTPTHEAFEAVYSGNTRLGQWEPWGVLPAPVVGSVRRKLRVIHSFFSPSIPANLEFLEMYLSPGEIPHQQQIKKPANLYGFGL